MGGGFGRGFGRGWRTPANGAEVPAGAPELATLQQQARQLQADLELIQGRIRELETWPERS